MRYVKIFIIAFFLNLLWEILHSLLYVTILESSVADYVPLIVFMSLKDALWITLIFGVIRTAARKFGKYNRPLVYSAFVLAALAFSFADEKISVNIGRWTYADAMPLVLGVGLTPLLEMAVTGMMAIVLSKRCS
jgi:hypothetical protein